MDPGVLIAAMKSVTASGSTVTFKLKYADSVWPAVLTTGWSDRGPEGVPVRQAPARREDHRSGPYELGLHAQPVAVFVPNPHYGGNDVLHNSEFIVRYEESATTLVSDEQQGAIDIAYRELTPTQLEALSALEGRQDSRRQGPRRFATSSSTRRSSRGRTQRRSSRSARQCRTWSIGPRSRRRLQRDGQAAVLDHPGRAGGSHLNSFSDVYGASPNVAKAKAVLKAAG